MIVVFRKLSPSAVFVVVSSIFTLVSSYGERVDRNDLSANEIVELMVKSADSITNGRFTLFKTVWEPGDKKAEDKADKKVEEYEKKWVQANVEERSRMENVEDFAARVMNKGELLAGPHTSQATYELTWSKDGMFKLIKTSTTTDYKDGQMNDFVEAFSSTREGFLHYFAGSRNLYINKPSQRPQHELLEFQGLGLFNEWLLPKLFLKYNEADVKFAGEMEVNGKKLPIVRIREVREKTIWGKVTMDVKMLIDPEMGFCPRKVQLVGNGKIGRELQGSGFQEIAPGIWRPRELEEILYESKFLGRPAVKSRTTIEITEAKINLSLTEDSFDLVIPNGAIVMDYRTGKHYLYEPAPKRKQ